MNWFDRVLNGLVWFVDLFRRTKGDPAPDPGHRPPPDPARPTPPDPARSTPPDPGSPRAGS